MGVEEKSKLLECIFCFESCAAEAVFPGEDFLGVVCFRVDFYAIGTEGFEAVDVCAKVGDLLARVFVAL